MNLSMKFATTTKPKAGHVISPQELKEEVAQTAEPLTDAALDELDDDELQILFWAQAG